MHTPIRLSILLIFGLLGQSLSAFTSNKTFSYTLVYGAFSLNLHEHSIMEPQNNYVPFSNELVSPLRYQAEVSQQESSTRSQLIVREYSRIGYGIGSSQPIADRFMLDMGVMAYTLKGEDYRKEGYHLNSNGELFLGVDIRLSNSCSFSAGPTLNFSVIDKQYSSPAQRQQFQGIYSIWQGPISSDVMGFGWLGLRTAFRLF